MIYLNLVFSMISRRVTAMLAVVIVGLQWSPLALAQVEDEPQKPEPQEAEQPPGLAKAAASSVRVQSLHWRAGLAERVRERIERIANRQYDARFDASLSELRHQVETVLLHPAHGDRLGHKKYAKFSTLMFAHDS